MIYRGGHAGKRLFKQRHECPSIISARVRAQRRWSGTPRVYGCGARVSARLGSLTTGGGRMRVVCHVFRPLHQGFAREWHVRLCRHTILVGFAPIPRIACRLIHLTVGFLPNISRSCREAFTVNRFDARGQSPRLSC